ncbi:MAG: hypothetical protein O7D29_08745 [Gemmatimonadetes bacterium]|nr:hypothetical protein [Gemmatimonadota bacterium]
MNETMGMEQFFSMEASEYLQSLDGLVSSSQRPNTEELVRLARALRGSAMMANQDRIAAAAGAFEAFCIALHQNKIQWDAGNSHLAVRATDDFKILVSGIQNWGDNEESIATRIIADLKQIAGDGPATRASASGLDVSARAFIAREGAAVSSALNQAGLSLEQNPADKKPLEVILRAMQPLLGIASLREAPPIPDLLDGIDRIVSDYARSAAAITNIRQILASAARALARAAREVASTGKPASDSEEALEFANLLGGALGAVEGAMGIEDLYFEDAGPHIVAQGESGVAAQLSTVDLVANGEFMAQAADQLETAESAIQRQLRGQSLQAKFREFARSRGAGLSGAFAEFSGMARSAIAKGIAAQSAPELAGLLREAATTLSRAGQDGDDALAGAMQALTESLRQLVGGEAPQAKTAPLAELPAAPAPPASAPLPAPPPTPPTEGGLAASMRVYEQRVASQDMTEPSLEELIAGPAIPASPAAAPQPTLAAAPPTAPEPTAVEAELPSIAELCYAGTAALTEALTLREKLQAALASGGEQSKAAELIDQVFDLVELGIDKK